MFCWRSSSGDIVEKSPVSYRRASLSEERPREATNEREREDMHSVEVTKVQLKA